MEKSPMRRISTERVAVLRQQADEVGLTTNIQLDHQGKKMTSD